jgi:thiol-disulfide isomerase/thioredoxin
MKKNIYLLLTLFILYGCSNNTFTINAETNHDEDLNVFLVKLGESNLPVVVDSTKVFEGKFSFTDSISVPEMHYVVFDKQRENLPVVIEPGTINVKVYKDSLRTSRVLGTKSNDDFSTYKLKTKDFYIELNKVQAEMRNANFARDTLLLSDLNSQFESLKDKLRKYEESFIVENNDSYLSSLILQRMLMNKEIDLEIIESYFSRFTDIIKSTKSSVEIKNKIEEMKKDNETLSIGSLAPDFTGPGLFAEPVSLSDVKSKVILLDFWASWCAPCRVENPSLVDLKSKYSDNEFQIVGVSLDRDMESWINAIENDNIKDWVHVSNLKFWGEPIAKLYKVTQMPTTFVLDESKNIIGVDVKGADLDAMIAMQLSK